jgi:hypothetical protein
MNYLTLSYLSGDKLLIILSLYKGLSYIEKVSYYFNYYFSYYFSYFQNYILRLSLIKIIVIIIIIIIIKY